MPPFIRHVSFPEASSHYLHTFDTMRKFKYHILEFPMTNALTIESYIMKWEWGHMPPIPYPLVAFESGFISNTNQHHLEAIPSKFRVSIIITSKILVSFAVLARISR